MPSNHKGRQNETICKSGSMLPQSSSQEMASRALISGAANMDGAFHAILCVFLVTFLQQWRLTHAGTSS